MAGRIRKHLGRKPHSGRLRLGRRIWVTLPERSSDETTSPAPLLAGRTAPGTRRSFVLWLLEPQVRTLFPDMR